MDSKIGQSNLSKEMQASSVTINQEMTAKLQKQEKYINFNKWLKNNGVIYNGISYPVAFGEQGIIGAAATSDIAPLTAFISIPNKIIISFDKAKFSELKSLFKQNKELFNEKENDEAGVNILTVFLMFERLKGKKSIWHEYFEIIDNPETILSWTNEEIAKIPDQYTQKQAKEYKLQVEELWEELKSVLHAYSHLFAKSTVTKELFLWAYNTVMSRCFGYTEQGTCLIPFGDCLNHGKYHATYLYIHRQFEQDVQKKHKQYIIKKKTIDLSIVDATLANNATPLMYHNPILHYIKQFQEDTFFTPSHVRTQMMPLLRNINLSTLKSDQNQELWNVPFFTTSDEEDNDTDSGEEEEKTKSREITNIKVKENSSMREALEKVRRYEEKLRNQAKQTPQEEEKAREERRKADEVFQQKLLEKQKQKLEQEAKDADKEQQGEELDLKHLYYLNEDEYDWYNCTDEDIFLVFASNKPISKGEQVYNFYGRRTNRYLLCWYGFTYSPNEYDSLSFRLFVHKKSEEITESNVKDFIYAEYISYDEWENGVKIGGKTIPADILSKEFRLKDGLLCDELLNYMRINKMQHYNGLDRDIIMVTQPRSINFELRVIEAALMILKEIQSGYLKETFQIGNSSSSSLGGRNSIQPSCQSGAHVQFAKILNEGHMNAIKRQIALMNISREILQDIAKGTADSFKNLYMKLYPQYETETEFAANREYLRKYLKSIHDGIFVKLLSK